MIFSTTINYIKFALQEKDNQPDLEISFDEMRVIYRKLESVFKDEAEEKIIYGASNNNVKVILTEIRNRIRTMSGIGSSNYRGSCFSINSCIEFLRNFSKLLGFQYNQFFVLENSSDAKSLSRYTRAMGINYGDYLKFIKF